jgi:DNA-binding XRE family transcriptional regulator
LICTVEKTELRHVARRLPNDPPGTSRSSARDDPDVACALDQLGKRIRALRRGCKLTQAGAASRAKLAETHWRDIERARTNPTVATLVGVACALQVTLLALFDDDET